MAMISNIIMVQQTLHHLNSQECAWAFLRIKDLFYEKGPMPLHYNMRMQMKKSGQRYAIVHKKNWLRKEIALEDRADGDENKNTRELLIEKKGFPSVYHSTYILCDLLTKY